MADPIVPQTSPLSTDDILSGLNFDDVGTTPTTQIPQLTVSLEEEKREEEAIDEVARELGDSLFMADAPAQTPVVQIPDALETQVVTPTQESSDSLDSLHF